MTVANVLMGGIGVSKQDPPEPRACSGPLTDREELVLQRRYKPSGEKRETLENIGQSLGLSRERVRQIECRALKKLVTLRPAILDAVV